MTRDTRRRLRGQHWPMALPGGQQRGRHRPSVVPLENALKDRWHLHGLHALVQPERASVHMVMALLNMLAALVRDSTAVITMAAKRRARTITTRSAAARTTSQPHPQSIWQRRCRAMERLVENCYPAALARHSSICGCAISQMDDEAFTNLLDALAHRAADCLDVILLLLPATACATLRLVNRSVSAAASADSCWTPRLVAKGFTAEGLALMPALALYGRVHQREACDIELLRRSRLRNASQEKWFAECALDLLNPFDTPVWLLFSTARDSSSASSYLQPSGGRVSLRTANGLACRGFVAANMTSNAIGGLLREMVLLRFDVERGEVSYDDSLAAGLADTTNGEAGSSSDVPAAASDAVSWLAVDAVLLPGRLAALGNKAPMLDASDDSQSDDDDDSIDFELLESETFGAQRRPQAPAVAQPQMSFTEQLRQLQMQQQQQQQPHARTQRQRQGSSGDSAKVGQRNKATQSLEEATSRRRATWARYSTRSLLQSVSISLRAANRTAHRERRSRSMLQS